MNTDNVKVVDAEILNDTSVPSPRLHPEQSLIGVQQRRIRDLETSIANHQAKIAEKKKEINICKKKIRLYKQADSLTKRK